MTTSTEEPPRGSWLQFSLRGLLALTALVALFFGWREWRLGPSRRQAAAIEAIRSAKGEVVAEVVGAPSWESEWLGIPHLQLVSELTLRSTDDATIEHAKSLEPLKVYVADVEVTQEALDRLSLFGFLSSLNFANCRVKASSFAPLRKMPSLSLRFEQTSVPRDALATLRGLGNFELCLLPARS